MLEIRRPKSGKEWAGMAELRYDILHKYLGLPKENPLKGKRVHIVAASGSSIVGSGELAVEGKKGHIRNIAVHRAHRHRRIGSRIMQKIEGIAGRKGLSLLYINARKHAKKFFRQLGFEPKGKPFVHKKAGTLHIRMEKRIKPGKK
jgi:N-acetylglutamate synthase-like GNAT family acetyltransferase